MQDNFTISWITSIISPGKSSPSYPTTAYIPLLKSFEPSLWVCFLFSMEVAVHREQEEQNLQPTAYFHHQQMSHLCQTTLKVQTDLNHIQTLINRNHCRSLQLLVCFQHRLLVLSNHYWFQTIFLQMLFLGISWFHNWEVDRTLL